MEENKEGDMVMKIDTSKKKKNKKSQWIRQLSRHTHLLLLMPLKILSHRTQFSTTLCSRMMKRKKNQNHSKLTLWDR